MNDPLVILGPEQSRFDPALADGGLPPLPGVQSFCVFRASRDTKPDGLGWTYHHHVDMACWRGRLYVAWNTCERDEDTWPSRELFATSADGATWSDPRELFPQGVSAPLRMYFFLAPNGRMLAIASLRTDVDDTREELKTGLVVREIRPDHTLGDVYTLQPATTAYRPMPPFESSSDGGFVEACRQLLADRVYLEQQDLGNLLGDRRMRWHHASNWPGGRLPGQTDAHENVKWTFGKGLSFLDRAGGAIVGVSKMGWTVVSPDGGETWSAPVVPSTLVTGKAKVFATVAATGERVLVYNPTPSQRWPLVLVASRDGGVTFTDMRVVHGELPRQRYEGRFRSVGPQYVRGISKWSDDRSLSDDALWLVYSVNKEDVWVARVPLPIVPDEEPGATIDDVFSARSPGPIVEGWNTYRPRWADASIAADGVLRLASTDPYDHAAASRVFGTRPRAAITLTLRVPPFARERVEVDVLSTFGSVAVGRVALLPDGRVVIGEETIGRYPNDRPFVLHLDVVPQRLVITVDDQLPVERPALSRADDVHGVTIRTSPYRNLGGRQPVAPGTDGPSSPVSVDVIACRIES